MEFSHTVENEVLTLVLAKDLVGDLQTSLFELTEKAIAEGARLCLVDLSEAEYINSTGLSILIRLLTKFRNHDGEVILLNPSQHVKKLLVMTRLNKIFQVENSKKEALNRFNN